MLPSCSGTFGSDELMAINTTAATVPALLSWQWLRKTAAPVVDPQPVLWVG